MDDVSFDIAAAPYGACQTLQRELGVSSAVAQVLVRRGLSAPDDAVAFLDADERHDAGLFAGIDVAVDLILEHASAGSRIIVHGDYDADGVCSTAILLRTLRGLGADVGWFLPGRREDGYGVSAATVTRLAGDGAALLITADCGITAVEEVALARSLGLDVVVTDHHQPRADGRLPDAPIVHPLVCGYPCVDLCAAGVAYKLAGALLEAVGEDPAQADRDLDIVALATVADCVPLRGENRRLVREGLAALRQTTREGLRALLRVTKTDPGDIDEQTIGFRLAPRINAAGRLQRADAGVELLLTDDPERAEQIATELDGINADRRHVETRILFEAQAQVARLGEQPAYVLAGEGWHPGVVGIVASRIVEQTHRPAVLIALDGHSGTGSGRSIPGFDLLAGLDACAGLLLRHGGHRAAAGCTIDAAQVDAFREAFVAHAAAVLGPEDLVHRQRVDAIVGGGDLGLPLAEDLLRLAPFGQDNPRPVLLVPAGRLSDPRSMGEGKHLRCTLTSGGARAAVVAFGRTSLPADATTPLDVACTLEINRWNGKEEPRVLLKAAADPQPSAIRFAARPEGVLEAALAEYAAFAAPAEDAQPIAIARVPVAAASHPGAAATIAMLVASRERVLVVAACEERRARQLAAVVGGFDICAWHQLARAPHLAAQYEHLVVLDPPLLGHERALLARPDARWTTHQVWDEPELRFARDVLEHDYTVDGGARALFAAVRAAPGAPLDEHLRGPADAPRTATQAGRQLRLLADLGLAAVDQEAGTVRLLPATPLALDRAPAYRLCEARLHEGRAWLNRAIPAAA